MFKVGDKVIYKCSKTASCNAHTIGLICHKEINNTKFNTVTMIDNQYLYVTTSLGVPTYCEINKWILFKPKSLLEQEIEELNTMGYR